MKIEKIDSNFSLEEKVSIEGERVRYDLPHSAVKLYGINYDKKVGCFTRMDLSVADSINENISALSRHTAGGKDAFCYGFLYIRVNGCV